MLPLRIGFWRDPQEFFEPANEIGCVGKAAFCACVSHGNSLLEAHKDPKKHPDLVVRVTGFTAYFATLSPQFRELVVKRFLEGL